MFPNEHAARMFNPDEFDQGSFARKGIAPGIDIVMGKRLGDDSMVSQSYRFDSDRWTEDQAKQWLAEHNLKPILFEPAKDGDLRPTETEQDILIFPRRKVFLSKYNTWYEFGDPFFDRVIQNFRDPSLFKPFIDEQHDKGVSFGDINDIYKGADGLHCKVVLNTLGAKAIKDRQYKYISPWFENLTDSNGVKHRDVLCSVSLTNIPALLGTVPQLQEQMALEYGQEEHIMYEKFKEYLKGKKVPEGITLAYQSTQLETVPDEEFMGKLQEFMDGLYEALTKVADMAAQIETLTGEKKQAAEQAEAAKLELAQVKETAEKAKTAALSAEADAFLLDYVNAGYPAALCAMKKEEYLKDPERVKKELSLWPKQQGGQKSVGAMKDAVKVSEEDRSIMLSLGRNKEGKFNFDPDNPDDVRRFRELNINVKDKE